MKVYDGCQEKCAICKIEIGLSKKCVLVAIEGTEEGNNERALPMCLECIPNLRMTKDYGGLIYCKLNNKLN